MRVIHLLAALALFIGGCAMHHGRDDDAGTSTPDARVPLPPGSCGDTPSAPECVELCEAACAELDGCGVAHATCIDSCYAAFACPGETPGHDAAICGGLSPGIGCASACAFARNWGGWSSHGIECPAMPPPPPPRRCEGLDFCNCFGDCEPLIDLTTGCLCPCEGPFNCTGELCSCACGGARYLGCVPVGQCASTEIGCGICPAIVADGCLACDDTCAVDG